MIAYNSDPDKAAIQRWQLVRNASITFQDASVPLKPYSTVILSSLAAIPPAALADLLEGKHRIVAIAEGIDTRAESGLGDVELRTVVKFAGFLRSLPAAAGDSKPDGSIATMKAEIERLTGNAIDLQCSLNESRAETEKVRAIERRVRAMCLAKEHESTPAAVEAMLDSLAAANAERKAVADVLGAEIGQLAGAAQALVDDYRYLSSGATPADLAATAVDPTRAYRETASGGTRNPGIGAATLPDSAGALAAGETPDAINPAAAQTTSPQPASGTLTEAETQTIELGSLSAAAVETPSLGAGTAENSPPRRGPGRPRATPKPQAHD